MSERRVVLWRSGRRDCFGEAEHARQPADADQTDDGGDDDHEDPEDSRSIEIALDDSVFGDFGVECEALIASSRSRANAAARDAHVAGVGAEVGGLIVSFETGAAGQRGGAGSAASGAGAAWGREGDGGAEVAFLAPVAVGGGDGAAVLAAHSAS